jgi:hypothetical protein
MEDMLILAFLDRITAIALEIQLTPVLVEMV